MFFRSLQGLLVLAAMAALSGCHGTGSCRHHHYAHACPPQGCPTSYQPAPYGPHTAPGAPMPTIEALPLLDAPPPAPDLPPSAPPAEARRLTISSQREIPGIIRDDDSFGHSTGDAIAEPLEPQQRLMPVADEQPAWYTRISAQVRTYFGM